MTKALTLEELREMVGQPVWCPEENVYGIIACDEQGKWAGIPFLYGIWGTSTKFNYNIVERKLKCFRIEDKKEIPMKLVSKVNESGNTKMVCPNCGAAAVFSPFGLPTDIYPYCPWCGQKLKGGNA